MVDIVTGLNPEYRKKLLKRSKGSKNAEVPKGSHKMPDGTIMKDTEHKKDDTKDDKENVAKENADKEIASLKDQIAMLKTKLENEKNKAVKPEPNPKTGEVPLTVGIAHKYFKDKEAKEDVKEAMSDRDKRIQKAKDMIKYYDAQKKAALKGKNKDLAKKMLKADMNADAKEIQTKKTDNYKSKNKEDNNKIKESTLYKYMVKGGLIK